MKKTQGEGEVMLMMKIRLKGGWKYLFEGGGVDLRGKDQDWYVDEGIVQNNEDWRTEAKREREERERIKCLLNRSFWSTMMSLWYTTSICFVISCTVQRTEFTVLIKRCRKKLPLLYSFIHQPPFKMTLLTEILVSVPCRLTVLQWDAFMLEIPIKITETNT